MPSAWIEDRWMNPARSAPPNQRRLRMHLALGEERAEALDRRADALLERRVGEAGQQLRERRAVDLGREREPHVLERDCVRADRGDHLLDGDGVAAQVV